MAGMRMPPRQKMINMMYLVLTAMLAMNVSKEVLDSFAILDADLVRSERAHAERSAMEYAVFADAAARMPEKFRAANERAKAMKVQADSLVRLIEGIKRQVIAEAEGLKDAELVGKDAAGHDTLRALLTVDAKDDREVLTRLLVGSAPEKPHARAGGAHDLKQRLAAFRDTVKAVVGGKDAAIASTADLVFDLRDRYDASGTLNNWESINFYDVPLAAGIATLSKLQADVRSTENDLVKWLYRSVTKDETSFSAITTAVIPQSNLIMVGDSFRADVFLAAYDPRNAPTVTLSGGSGPLPIGADGKAKLRLPGSSVGEQQVSGTIKFQSPDGMKEVPYSTSFQVMAPLLVASPTKMNVLYRGVDNPIDLSVPGVPADRIQASISTGRIIRSGRGWVANGMSGNTAEVYAIAQRPDGSSQRIGPQRFRVKDLPPPSPIISGVDPGVTKVARPKLCASPGLLAKALGSEFGDNWQVISYQFTLVRNGQAPIIKLGTGNEFTPDIKTILCKLRTGDQIYVEEIKARLSNGQGTPRNLAPIAIKVQ